MEASTPTAPRRPCQGEALPGGSPGERGQDESSAQRVVGQDDPGHPPQEPHHQLQGKRPLWLGGTKKYTNREKKIDIVHSKVTQDMQDIQASPANRMTHAILFILGIFVCLAPMLEVNSTQDDHKKKKEVLESSINSLKEHKFKMDAQADKLTEQTRIVDGMLDVLQNTGPEYSAAKKKLETLKENSSELKAALLQINENVFTSEWAQNKGLGYDDTYSPLHTCQPSGNRDFIAVSSRSIVNSLSPTSELLQPTG
ncbi:unnamed protein product [Gadus morhua 'NCC']